MALRVVKVTVFLAVVLVVRGDPHTFQQSNDGLLELSSFGTTGRSEQYLLSDILDDKSEGSELYQTAYDFGGFPVPFVAAPGDTPASVADRYSISFPELVDLNRHLSLSDPESPLSPPGLAMNIPGMPAIPPLPTTVTFPDEDTLTAFAAAYNISMDSVWELNEKLADNAFSKSTTTFHVPASENDSEASQPDCPGDAICVEHGQTLSDLAAVVDADVEELLLSNPQILRQGGRLFVGQVLFAPGAEPSMPEDPIVVTALQSPYQALASRVGLPLTPDFLQTLANANSLESVDQLVTISDQDAQIELPRNEEEDQPADAETPAAETREADEIQKTAVPAPKAAAYQTILSRGRSLFSPGGYRRRLIEMPDAPPMLSRLHKDASTARLLSNDDLDSLQMPSSTSGRRLYELMHASDEGDADEHMISSTAKRLYNLIKLNLNEQES